jgi:hypothetical protein
MQMRWALFAAVGLMAASPARAAPIETRPWAPGGSCTSAADRCAIRIQFGSVCCGPDQATGAKVARYIRASRAITKAIKCPNGKEGEYELCLVIPNKARARSIFQQLKRMIPAPGSGPSGRGTTSITLEP